MALLDVVLSVIILGIVSAIAAPKFADTLSRYRVAAAAKRVQADLGAARQRALAGSTTVTVTFNPAAESYTIPQLPDLNHPRQGYTVDLTTGPYFAEIVSASLGGDAHLQFSRFGQPDSGGVITVRVRGFQQTVTVNGNSGAATIP